MSQGDLGTLISSETSGAQLAQLLRDWRDALHTLHSGAARPSYVKPGMLWIDTSAANWILKLWTGQVDVALETITPNTGARALDARYARQNLAGLTDVAAAQSNLGVVWNTIYTGTFNAQAQFSLTNLAAYRSIRVTGRVFTSAGAAIFLQTSTNNGASWGNTSGDFTSHYFGAQGTASSQNVNSETGAYPLTNGSAVSNNPDLAAQIDLLMEPFNAVAYLRLKSDVAFDNASGPARSISDGRRNSNVARNAFRIFPQSGTISGALVVEGARA